MSNQSPTGNHERGAAQPLECGDLSPLFKNRSPATPAPLTPNPPRPHPPWPHAPVHKLSQHGFYMVTAGTFQKQRLFHDGARLDLLLAQLLARAEKHRWQLEAWALLANHYHIVVRGNPDSASLRQFITHLHADSARELNRLDATSGRRVWFNFWDTKLTFEKSYLPRLHYVHQNPVKHRPPGSNDSPRLRWCRRFTVSRRTSWRCPMTSEALWSAQTCLRFPGSIGLAARVQATRYRPEVPAGARHRQVNALVAIERFLKSSDKSPHSEA